MFDSWNQRTGRLADYVGRGKVQVRSLETGEVLAEDETIAPYSGGGCG